MLEYLIIKHTHTHIYIYIYNNIFTACNGENYAEIKKVTL